MEGGYGAAQHAKQLALGHLTSRRAFLERGRAPGQLERRDRVGQPLEREGAKVGEAIAPPATDERPHDAGKKDLPGPRLIAQTLGDDHGRTEVVIAGAAHLPGVQADPQTDRLAAALSVASGNTLLHRDRASHCCQRAGEADHQAVAQALHLAPAQLCGCLAQHHEVLAKHALARIVPQAIEQRGGAGEIREQQRNHPGVADRVSDRGRTPALHPRIIEGERRSADPDHVAMTQPPASSDELVVHERTVARDTVVHDQPLPCRGHQLGVHEGYAAIPWQSQVGVVTPSDRHRSLSLEREGVLVAGSVRVKQERGGYVGHASFCSVADRARQAIGPQRKSARLPPSRVQAVTVALKGDDDGAPAMSPPRADNEPALSPFPQIADYAFLSDCESCALIAPSGNVEWLCLPRIDSPSVFGALLDRHAGGFRLGPADVQVPAARRYLPGTMCLETSWGTATGWIIVRDLLLIGPWHHEEELSHTHRRAPTDYDSNHVLLRTARCVNGDVQIELDCEPMFDYGRLPATWDYTDRSYHQGRARADGVDVELRLTTDMRIGFEGGRATARTLLKEGQTRFCALSWSEHNPPYTFEEAYRRLVWTAHHWQHWLARGRFPDHPWRSHLERSALTLKGLSFAPTGALVAAATTSLPETPGGERNWDYRYSWIRDAAFARWGLHTLGFDWEANDFFWFLADVAERDEQLQLMYGVDGERDLDERILDHLSGYEGASPVRVGNAAHTQRQHDVWGAVLDSVYIHVRSVDRLDDRIWPLLSNQVEQALAHWREPDHGIWEVRGEPRHFTSSKVMCWVAVDRGARLARIRGKTELADRWQAAADEIHTEICERALDERGVFSQHYD